MLGCVEQCSQLSLYWILYMKYWQKLHGKTVFKAWYTIQTLVNSQSHGLKLDTIYIHHTQHGSQFESLFKACVTVGVDVIDVMDVLNITGCTMKNQATYRGQHVNHVVKTNCQCLRSIVQPVEISQRYFYFSCRCPQNRGQWCLYFIVDREKKCFTWAMGLSSALWQMLER